jgi:hypothetical protein
MPRACARIEIRSSMHLALSAPSPTVQLGHVANLAVLREADLTEAQNEIILGHTMAALLNMEPELITRGRACCETFRPTTFFAQGEVCRGDQCIGRGRG